MQHEQELTKSAKGLKDESRKTRIETSIQTSR